MFFFASVRCMGGVTHGQCITFCSVLLCDVVCSMGIARMMTFLGFSSRACGDMAKGKYELR